MPYSLQVSPELFLSKYWQQKPLFLPGSIEGFVPPVSADELAGAAMDAHVDARILESSANDWELFSGPFNESDFQRDVPWTLLVQEIDALWEPAAELFELVSFLPAWRLADVMMSYAVNEASAGPHFDLYDVFIVQGEGKRLWRLGQACDASTPLRSHDRLRILTEFETQAEYEMKSGDVLYIPPGIAHWGVSQGESTSFSIGCRAPRMSDVLARTTDAILQGVADDELFQDPQRKPAVNRGEVDVTDLDRVRAQVLQYFEKLSPIALGELLTEPIAGAEPIEQSPPMALSLATLSKHGVIGRSRPSALAWCGGEEELTVFANGVALTAPSSTQAVLERWCSGLGITVQELSMERDTALLTDRLLSEEALTVYE
ncbi:MAG: cupin domain-containing protein [Pseudomonadota bacterium]